MRFIILGVGSPGPDGRPSMTALDFIEAGDADTAVRIFKEDNPWTSSAGFSGFMCVRIEGDFVRFGFDPPA